MATVRERLLSGGTASYAVLFRLHGRQKSRTFVSRDAADTFVRAVEVLGIEGALAHFAAGPAALTLDQLAERYLAYKATRVRSDRTVADYRRDYRNWVSPVLGSMPADAVTEADVQNLVDAMGQRLSPKSVNDRHAIVFGIYKWAAAPSRRLAARNPCIGTDLPKRRKTQPKGLRPNEWAALHSALAAVDKDAADLAEFLLASGWRWSEGAALDAFDVEDDGVRMHVSMGRVIRRNAAGRHVVVEDAKSDAGVRRVELDADCAEMVRGRLGNRARGLVFATKAGSQWHYSNFLNRCWKPAVKAAGLTRAPSPHWLRHTHVAWMVMGGKTNLPELQRRIGHEHISTTIDVYGRMIADVNPEALQGFAAMRKQASLPSPRPGLEA